jgi:hypothetical protein
MAKTYSKIWMPLSDYTARHLPFPEGPLRAGERLGKDRRLTVLHGRHLDGDIKIRKCNGNCAPCTAECEVKPGDWFRAEYALSLLVGKDWKPIGPVEVLAYDLIEEDADDADEAKINKLVAFLNDNPKEKETTVLALAKACFPWWRRRLWREARGRMLPVNKRGRGNPK